MSKFSLPLARVMQLFDWPMIVEARKRVCYKRFLAAHDVEFNPEAPTAQLKALYYGIAKGHAVQSWPADSRQSWRRWDETDILKIIRADDEEKARAMEAWAKREAARAFVFGD